MRTYKELTEEFYRRYRKPVVEPYILGYSGIDPPLKPHAGDEWHEGLTHLLGGDERGHYHLTGKEYRELLRFLDFPPEIETGQRIDAVSGVEITAYAVRGRNVRGDEDMAKRITSVVWSATDLPSGLSINANNGEITGTPTVDPGTYTAKVKVVTNYGSDEKEITITVGIPESWLPVIDAGQTITCTAEEAMTAYTVTGTNVTLTV